MPDRVVVLGEEKGPGYTDFRIDVPDDMVEFIDKYRGGETREQYMERAIAEYLAERRQRQEEESREHPHPL